MTDPRPLWEVIDRAWWSSVDTEDPHSSPPASDQAADVILAVRDWILRLPNGYDWSRMQAEALARVLTAEADRAERGETVNPSENDQWKRQERLI